MQRLIYLSRCHSADKLAHHQRELWWGAEDQGGEGSSALYTPLPSHSSPFRTEGRQSGRQETASQYCYEHATSLLNCHGRGRMETSVLITTGAFIVSLQNGVSMSLSWMNKLCQTPFTEWWRISSNTRCLLLCVLQVMRSGTSWPNYHG